MKSVTAVSNTLYDLPATSGDDKEDMSAQIAYLLSQKLPSESVSHEPMSWGKTKIGGQKRNKKRYKIAKKSRKTNRK